MNQTLAQAQSLTAHTSAGLASLTGGVIAILVLAALFFFFARAAGRGRFVALLVSLYAGFALYSIFPFMNYLPSAPAITALVTRLALYGALSAVTYLVLRRVVVSDFIRIGTIGLVVLALLGAGFLLALAYHIFPVREVYAFTPTLNTLFAAKAYFFWWFAGPLIGLFAFAR